MATAKPGNFPFAKRFRDDSVQNHQGFFGVGAVVCAAPEGFHRNKLTSRLSVLRPNICIVLRVRTALWVWDRTQFDRLNELGA